MYKKERQSKGMKKETRKIYHAILAFYKITIIPVICWSFERSKFRLNPSDLLDAVTVNSTPVLERTDVPKIPFDNAFRYPERLRPEQWQPSEC
jgi:hypothetical protein